MTVILRKVKGKFVLSKCQDTSGIRLKLCGRWCLMQVFLHFLIKDALKLEKKTLTGWAKLQILSSTDWMDVHPRLWLLSNRFQIQRTVHVYPRTQPSAARACWIQFVNCFFSLSNTPSLIPQLTCTIAAIFKQDGQWQFLDTMIKENKCHLHSTPRINNKL